MIEQYSRWEVGQEVLLQKVNPYRITQLIGEAGRMQIDEKGHYHAFWQKEYPDGRIALVHHGGPEGFATLSAVKHQHERVIARYVGISVDIPPDEQEEGTTPNQTFPELARQLLEIPGEQQRVTQWIQVLQETNRDLPKVRIHGELSRIRDKLQGVLDDNLSRSVNSYKRAAALSLVTGLAGERADLLGGINQAQLQLLLRAQQAVAITLGTMQRYNALERLQVNWNEVITHLPGTYASAVKALQEGYDTQRRERNINVSILHEHIGVFARLEELKGEPYLSHAQRFIRMREPVQRLWEERNYQQMIKDLTNLAGEAEVWSQRIREESTGVDFGKYRLS